MANKSKAGRRRSDAMPSVTVDRKTQYARISIGGTRHALGKAPGGKITPRAATGSRSFVV